MPTGLRIALANPERITGIISQNGNAYEEGLSDGGNPIERYWRDPTECNTETGLQRCQPRGPSRGLAERGA
jgi:hypothetical protein